MCQIYDIVWDMKALNKVSNEELVLEMVRRSLLSAKQAHYILDPRTRDDATVQAQADQWIKENPEIYAEMKKRALAFVAKKKRFSIRLISEEVRWLFKSEKRPQGYKIKDGLTPYLGVRICQEHPEVRKFIRTRKKA